MISEAGSIGAAAFFFLVIFILLAVLYLLAIIKVIGNNNLTVRQKIFRVLVSPLLIGIGIIVRYITGYGDTVGLIIIGLIIFNLAYVLNPLNLYLTNLIYSGPKVRLQKTIYWFFTITTSVSVFLGVLGSIVLIIKH